MVLGTEDILHELEVGRIVCDMKPSRVEGAHIDVTLGGWYWVKRPGFHPLDLRSADPDHEFDGPFGGDQGKDVIIPSEGFVLAHTAEFIGTAPGSGLLPLLYTRSTLARWGLSAHEAAGLGDVGFVGRWALQIHNPHRREVRIPVGSRIGCIVFMRVSGETTEYAINERYNIQRDAWSPVAMLPRRGNW
jgi:dCTP deaminase